MQDQGEERNWQQGDGPNPVVVKLAATTDARVWAEEWCRVARELAAKGVGEDLIDEGWMIGWFANAIEVGRAAGIAEGKAAKIQAMLDEVDAAEAEDARREADEEFWGEIEVEDDEAGDR